MKKRELVIQTIKSQPKEFHPTQIAAITKISLPYVCNILQSLVATKEVAVSTQGRKVFYQYNPIPIVVPPQVQRPVNTVQEKFEYIRKLVQMVIDRKTPSLFITGVSGVGKTFLVKEQFKKNQYRENIDYTYIKGYTTPFGLYQTLYENMSNIVVFDDCDKAFENDLSMNILKATLDSYDKRDVSWVSNKTLQSADVPPKFEFKGQVIFISNVPVEKLDDAIRSRTYCMSLFMNRSEITDYMRHILPQIESHVELPVKTQVLDFLQTIQSEISDYNIRTLIKSIRIRTVYQEEKIWKSMVRLVSVNDE